MPCVFADGWPAVFSVSTLSSVDRTSGHTKRLEKVLYRIDVSHGLLSRSLFDAYCKDVSMLLFGSSFPTSYREMITFPKTPWSYP